MNVFEGMSRMSQREAYNFSTNNIAHKKIVTEGNLLGKQYFESTISNTLFDV